MTFTLCDIDATATGRLPEHTEDRSGIGVHYVDAFIKPMNATLEDGTKVTCKRRGLKITLAVGERKGEGLMRRAAIGPSPVAMLDAALREAAAAAGVDLRAEGGKILLDI